METKKILGAIGVGALLVGATVALTHKVDSNNTQDKIEMLKADYEAKLAEKPKVEYLPGEKVLVPGPVEIKEVDNKNLPTVLKFVEDNVDEDVTMDYIQFEVDSKIDAEAYVRDNMISMLKDDDYFESGALFDNFRTSEVTISKIYDAEILDRDFEDKDLTLKYEVKMKAKESGEDAVYHNFEVIIPFEEGKLVEDDIELNLI
jgi:hypothetical protein